ncbi:MAG: ATP-grasp domain-containing protein [Desulfobaccales bacterium]
MTKPKVLVTGVGGVIGYGIVNAIKMAKLPVEVIGAEADKEAVGFCFVNDRVVIPRANEPGYTEFLVKYITRHGVNLVIPGVDHDLHRMVADRSAFQGNGFMTILPDEQVYKITEDKWNTHLFLKSHGIPVIPTFCLEEDEKLILSKLNFPMIAKPRSSSAGKGLVEVENKDDFRYYQKKYSKSAYIVQEKVGHDDMEFTCGSYQVKDSRLFGPIILKRKLGYGSTMKGKSIIFPEIADRVNQVLTVLGGGAGPYCTQIRLNNSCPLVLEINARFSSSTSIKALMGFNEPAMLIKEAIFEERLEHPDLIFNKTVCRYLLDQILP